MNIENKVYLYVPECPVKYSAESLVCPSDLVSLPVFSLSEVSFYSIDILVFLLPYTLPVLVMGFSVVSILHLLRSKP